MSKKCPDCGSLNVEEVFDNEAYCKDCFLHCAADDLEDASVFDRITESPEVLAETFVFSRGERYWRRRRCETVCYEVWWSALTGEEYKSKAEAITATLERLKEVEK